MCWRCGKDAVSYRMTNVRKEMRRPSGERAFKTHGIARLKWAGVGARRKGRGIKSWASIMLPT